MARKTRAVTGEQKIEDFAPTREEKDATLAELVPSIKYNLQLGCAAWKKGVRHFWLAGRDLNTAVPLVEPKKREEWLQKNVGISVRQSLKYRKFAREVEYPTAPSKAQLEEIEEKWARISAARRKPEANSSGGNDQATQAEPGGAAGAVEEGASNEARPRPPHKPYPYILLVESDKCEQHERMLRELADIFGTDSDKAPDTIFAVLRYCHERKVSIKRHLDEQRLARKQDRDRQKQQGANGASQEVAREN